MQPSNLLCPNESLHGPLLAAERTLVSAISGKIERPLHPRKRTYFVDVIRLQMRAICSLLNYAYFTIPTKAEPARKTVQPARQR